MIIFITSTRLWHDYLVNGSQSFADQSIKSTPTEAYGSRATLHEVEPNGTNLKTPGTNVHVEPKVYDKTLQITKHNN